jgi:hypothetical protein
MAALRKIFASLRGRLAELLRAKEKLDAHSGTQAADSDDMKDDGHMDEESSMEQIDHSLSLVTRRLAVLSKRWPLMDLLGKGDEEQEDLVIDKFCDRLFRLVTRELELRQTTHDDGSQGPSPDIWEKYVKSHAHVAETVQASLDVLLSTTAWIVRKTEANLEIKEQVAEDGDEKPNLLVVMRQRIDMIVSLCFEQYIEEQDKQTAEQKQFSEILQKAGGRVSGDLRMLFPRQWSNSFYPVLREAALVEDSHLIGGLVRYVRQHNEKVREVFWSAFSQYSRKTNHSQSAISPPQVRQAEETGDPTAAHDLLLPMARGLVMNWDTGNRREAGLILSHITGSGPDAAKLAAEMSSKLKKVRLLPLVWLASYIFQICLS